MNKASIWSIGTAVPKFKHAQSAIRSYMEQRYNPDETLRRKIAALYAKSKIDFRHSILPDFSSKESTVHSLNVEQRMEIYAHQAPLLALESVKNCVAKLPDTCKPTHIITVSCTGLLAPGLDVMLLQALNLPPSTVRSSVNFMGCYAAIHALRLANWISQRESSAIVLIVCVELCTLHFQTNTSSDNILASMLFADGAAAAIVSKKKLHQTTHIQIEKFFSHLSENSTNLMEWNIGSNAFSMVLHPDVPQTILQTAAPAFKKWLLASTNNKIPQNWAIHPGGPKIISAWQQAFDLKDDQVSAGKEILQQYGNMSSPTILFVLESIWQNKNLKPNSFIPMLAFGPGLSTESALVSLQHA